MSGEPAAAAAVAPMVLVEKKEGGVALIRLNRPKQLNALCDGLFTELNVVLTQLDADKSVGALVLTGNEKAFAAGADIKEMEKKTTSECFRTDMLGHWFNVSKLSKPIIAAVNGYALGGGCELAMMCDIIIAGENAKFGQPEVKIGTIPGGGATQRLVKAVGKSKAMVMILTGDPITAQEAERSGANSFWNDRVSFLFRVLTLFCMVVAGLVSHVVPDAQVVDKAVEIAKTIANRSQPVIALAKEAVNVRPLSPFCVAFQYS
jgi:enoyl-CoA hydratase